MKKPMIIRTVILILATTALTACAGKATTTIPTATIPTATQSSSTPIPSSNSSIQNSDIGVDKAKENALKHAGLSANEVVFVKEKLEKDNSLREYDIDFVSDTTKYEYEINSTDGTVMQFSQESIMQTSSNLTANIAGDIGTEKAKEIALKAAGFSANDVTFIKVKFDTDDGMAEYEVSFVVNKIEHDYSIHATSGEIIGFSIEEN